MTQIVLKLPLDSNQPLLPVH